MCQGECHTTVYTGELQVICSGHTCMHIEMPMLGEIPKFDSWFSGVIRSANKLMTTTCMTNG